MTGTSARNDIIGRDRELAEESPEKIEALAEIISFLMQIDDERECDES